MKLNKAWGSHLPVLIKLMNITDGDVLELGTGLYSTPFLHWACYGTGRKIVSYDNHPFYLKYMGQYRDTFHKIITVENWDDIKLNHPWSIAFIDHAPDFRRKEEAKKVANHAKYIVIHDSDPKCDDFYKYSEIYPLFKYRYDYTKVSPNTTILSNIINLDDLNI